MPTHDLPALPHAFPFLLLDRILEVRPGQLAIAMRRVTADDPLAEPDGCLPPVLLAEALAQCAGVAVRGMGTGAVLARLDRFRSRCGRVPAGVELRIHARVVRVFGAVVKVRGVVWADGQRWAAGEVVLRVDQPNE